MKAQTLQAKANRRLEADFNGSEETEPFAAKKQWLEKYASRILGQFLRWQTPLGVTPAYTGKVKSDLALFYEDPLKRMFIEATY